MNPEQLLNDLVHLAKTESDLQDICFSLKVDYADIEGSSHKDKARELVLYLNRRGRLLDILKLLLEIQPDLATTYRTSIEENASISTNIMIQLAGVSSFSVLSQSDSPVQAKNPYQVGRMLTNPDNFWGREDERRNICSQLYNRGSSSIVGMRRIGKSSLLYFLSHYEPRIVSLPNLFAYLDLQKTTHHTLSGLLNAAFQQWVAQINPHAQAHHVADMINFTHIIRRLNEKGYHPILCLDEFENLTKRPYTFTDDVFEGWRALANQGQLTFLTASRAPLADIIQQNGLTSSFYNVFYQVNLSLLTRQATYNLLETPIIYAGLGLPEGLVEKLINLCGMHPFYLQIAAHFLFDSLSMQNYSWPKLHNNFVVQAENHWRDLWNSLNQREKTTFLKAANHLLPIEDVRSARQLTLKGLLIHDDLRDTYYPFSQGFVSWLGELNEESLV